jgi:hypothetical protein
MALSLTDFRALIRLQLDSDPEDLTDPLIDSWVREGWRYCVYRNRRWPFYRSAWQFTAVEGNGAYDEGSLGGPANAIQELDAVIGADGAPLRWVGFEEGQRAWGDASGRPLHWTVNAGVLRLYPTPDAAYSMTAYGFRLPVDWVDEAAPGQKSDLPDAFDDVILEWCIGRAYQRQEDGDMGVMHLDQAEVLLRNLQRRYMRQTSSAPLVLNDGVRHSAERAVVWDL